MISLPSGGDLLSAGTDFVTGYFNRQAQEETNEQNRRHWQANLEFQDKWAAANRDMQYDFAKQGVRWKVADAQAAGLHPLAALGAQTQSFSPITVGTSNLDQKAPQYDFGNMGQSLGRAIDAGTTNVERTSKQAQAMQQVANTFQLEKMNLENEVLKTDIALKRAQLPPAFPANELPGNWATMVSGGPDRTMGGRSTDTKELEVTPEGGMSYKKLPFYGMDIALPNWLASGAQWEDVLGELGGSAMGAANIPGIVGYNIARRLPDWVTSPIPHRPSAHERRWRRNY